MRQEARAGERGECGKTLTRRGVSERPGVPWRRGSGSTRLSPPTGAPPGPRGAAAVRGHVLPVPEHDAALALREGTAVGGGPRRLLTPADYDSMHEPGQPERQTPLAREAPILVGANSFVTTACVVLVIVIVGTLVLLRGVGDSQYQGAAPIASSPAAPANTITMADTTIRTSVVRDEIVATPYVWVIDGERTDRTPRLSPDGRRAAWLPQLVENDVVTNRIIVRDLESGAERDLTPEPGFGYSSVHWSPDSQTLAFVKYRREEGEVMPSELWRVDADGSNLQQLYRNGRSSPGAGGPSFGISAWSNDGRRVALGGTIWGNPLGGPLTWVSADGTAVAQMVPGPTAAECGVTDNTQVVQPQLVAPTEDYALCVVKTAGLLQAPVSAPAGGFPRPL